MLVLDGTKVADDLHAMAILRQPAEAVGLLTADGRIFELPNHAESPGDSFVVHKADIMSAIYKNELENDLGDLTLWHSHPNGGVGPSRIDMQQKLPFFNHLVVTLTDTEPIFTWY